MSRSIDELLPRTLHILNGVDRWIGGVRLDGPRAAWRWDRARGALSRASG